MDSNLRLECLRLASMLLGLNGRDIDVVAVAREYEQYATGEAAKFVEPKASVTSINDRGPRPYDAVWMRWPNIYADDP